MKPGPLQTRMQLAADRLARSVCALKSQWLDNQMKRVLPPELYAFSDKPNQKLRSRVAAWIMENKITICEDPGGVTDLLKDGIIISQFRVRFKDGKAEVMYREFPL